LGVYKRHNPPTPRGPPPRAPPPPRPPPARAADLSSYSVCREFAVRGLLSISGIGKI